MLIHSLFILVAAIGIFDTLYLIYKRKTNKHPACPLKGSCEEVLAGQYNKTLSIHNDLIGFLFYSSVAIVSILLMFATIPEFYLLLILKAAILVALIMTIRFLYLMSFVIRQYCFWCLVSAGLTITLAIFTFFI